MGVFQNNLMGAAAAAASAGGGGFYSHQISNSVRMVAPSGTAASNSRLTRTVGTVDSNVHWTLNFWIKRSAIEGTNPVASARTLTMFTPRSGTSGSVLQEFLFGAPGSYGAGDAFVITNTNTGAYVLSTDNLFRDTSAWYNIHIQADLDNGTAGEKLKIFVNGTEASYNVDNRSSYTSLAGMVAGAWTIGDYYGYGYPIQSYLAQWCYIDGTTYASSEFGETKNGVWIPKNPSGLTFGSEGHLLNFESSSDLGNDSSGNNNDWTSVNLAASDQMTDSPTFGSEGSANFATLLGKLLRSYGRTYTMSEGNLQYAGGHAGETSNQYSTMGASSGKWYAEFLIETVGSNSAVGIAPSEAVSYDNSIPYTNQNSPGGMGYLQNGNARFNNSDTSSGYATYTTGDVIQVAMDIDNTRVWFGKNNTWQNSGDPAAGSNASYTDWTTQGTFSTWHFATAIGGTSGVHICNFGQEGTFAGEKTAGGNADGNGYGNFLYAPPTGFLAMCAGNLPTAEEVDPAQTDDDYPQKLFSATLWTGNGSGRTISSGSKSDFVFIKRRNGAAAWAVQDSTRGTSAALEFNTGASEDTSFTQGVTAFGSSSFNIGTHSQVNSSSDTYVGYAIGANDGTTAANSVGDTASVTQVDPSGAFSIVTYTGFAGASGTSTVGHGLSTAPSMIIHKSRTRSSGWWTTFPGLLTSQSYFLNMENDNAQTDLSSYGTISAPTASVFTINGVDGIGGESANYVAYCFANVEGYCKVGSYDGNANDDGTFVYTGGLRPSFFLCKPLVAGNWRIQDIARSPINVADETLYPNHSIAEESTTSDEIDILSNGVKMRASDSNYNQATTFVYLAMAHNPFQYATAR